MVINLPIRAFLEIKVDPDTWDLPKKYNDAMEPYIDSIPTSFFLPWPVELLVPVNHQIDLSGLPISIGPIIVHDVEYQYSSPSGYAAHMCTDTKIEQGGVFNITCLLCLSEEGFLIENQRKTIKEVLESAGLPATTETYETQK